MKQNEITKQQHNTIITVTVTVTVTLLINKAIVGWKGFKITAAITAITTAIPHYIKTRQSKTFWCKVSGNK